VYHGWQHAAVHQPNARHGVCLIAVLVDISRTVLLRAAEAAHSRCSSEVPKGDIKGDGERLKAISM
jgi:hypothetical protein